MNIDKLHSHQTREAIFELWKKIKAAEGKEVSEDFDILLLGRTEIEKTADRISCIRVAKALMKEKGQLPS